MRFEWTVKPCELTDIAALTKVYDGTDNLPDTITFAYDGGTVTLTSAGENPDYTATGAYASAGVGTSKNASVKVKLKNENYTFANGEETKEFILDFTGGKAAITKAEATEPEAGEMTVFNNLERTYSYDDLTKLLPELPDGQKFGELSYSVKDSSISTDYIPDTSKISFNFDMMQLSVEKVDTDVEGSIGTLELTVKSENFEDFTLQINVLAVNRYRPTGSPTLSPSEITYGTSLNGISLSGELTYNEQTVDGDFRWEDGTVKPDAGSYTAKWTFTPRDHIYAETTGTAAITVNPAQLTGVVVNQQDDLTYNGKEQQASVETSATAVNDQPVTFTYCGTPDGTYSETVPAFINAGEYTVYYKATAPNHEDATGSFKVTIQKADPVCTAPTGVSAVYGQMLREIRLTNLDGNTPGTWTWEDATQRVGDVGEHPFKAKFTPDDEVNYNSMVNITVFVTVGKAQPTVSAAPAAKDLVYTGQAQALIEPGATADGTMMYSLSKDGDYAQIIPTGIGAGKYVVWYRIIGDGNHKDSEPASVEVTIARQPVAIPEADASEFIYNGADHTYTLAENARYTIADNVKKDAGVYTVTVTLKDTGNFVWSDNTDAAKEYTFTIAAAQLTVTVTDKRAYVYGTAPDLRKPVLDRDYTVSGLIGSDELITAPTLTYDPVNPKLNKIGEAAAIRASGASAGRNYEITYVDGKLTVIARPSSGGSASTYPITIKDSKNGSAASSRNRASAGEIVTITVTPDKGYTLETITVTGKNGKALKLTDQGGGRYTFTMPASGVTVTATFMDDNTMLNFFVDVKASDYFYDAVLWAAQNDITTGTDAVHFSPNQPCTRAQIVTFLWRAAGSPVVNYAMNMTDVPGDAYYAEAVRWALSEGVTTGTTKTTFSPNETCTRAQAVAFLLRFAAPAAVTLQELVSGFSDADSVPGYALPAMNWALAGGIVQGSGTKLLPNDSCTRAQIVTLLYRLHLSK